MLKLFNRKKKDNKGFTLVELVIVVAILAILVGLLAPQYTKYVEKSRQAADVSNLDDLVKGFKVAAADTDYDIIPSGTDTATFTILIDANGTKISADDKAPTGWVNAIKEYTGYDFSNEKVISELKLKSKKWRLTTTTGGTTTKTDTTAIEAIVKISSDGSVVAEYNPATIKDVSNKTNN